MSFLDVAAETWLARLEGPEAEVDHFGTRRIAIVMLRREFVLSLSRSWREDEGKRYEVESFVIHLRELDPNFPMLDATYRIDREDYFQKASRIQGLWTLLDRYVFEGAE